MFKFDTFGKTDKGIRVNNEDSFLVMNKPSFVLAAVADGMGGHKGGRAASNAAIKSLKQDFDKADFSNLTDEQIQRKMVKSVRDVQKKLIAMAEEDPELLDMGTTLNLNLFVGEKLFTVNIGDSRCTHFHNRKQTPISEDHNLATLAKKGLIDPKFMNHTNYLTSSLGPRKEAAKVDFYVTELGNRGHIFVTSDGVHQFILVKELHKIIKSKKNLEWKVEQIIKTASKNKSNDNMTIIAVQYEK